jgi:hypothetical protein
MFNLGSLNKEIELYSPDEEVNDFGETQTTGYTLQITAMARRRDIEWSTIGEEAHGKQLVVEARTEFYIKKFRSEITEKWIVKYNNRYYEITRVDEFGKAEYTRILGLRRDNWTPTINVRPR